MNHDHELPDLARLVKRLKGDRSYERLSRDCGGIPTSKRLQQIANNDIHTFPEAATIEGLARGLGVPITEVVLAAARALGLRVRDSGLQSSDVVLAGVNDLPDAARDAVLSVARQMVALHRSQTPAEVQESYGLASRRGVPEARAIQEELDRQAEAPDEPGPDEGV